MDFFRKARVVRLRSCRGQYLIAKDERTVTLCNEENVAQWEEETRLKVAEEMQQIAEKMQQFDEDMQRIDVEMQQIAEEMPQIDRVALREHLLSRHGLHSMERDNEETIALRDGKTRLSWWSVEFINSDSVLHLKSCYSKYLTASDQRSLQGMTGCKVLLSSPPLDSSHELEPVMEDTQVKLRTHYGTFLCANGDHITHDLPDGTTILWNVEVVETEEEESATNIDDKASEEGPATKRSHETGQGSPATRSPQVEREEEESATNIDDKASEGGSATKRSHETGEGSSATRSPQKDSGPIQEADQIKYRRHFWKLKNLLLDYSGEKHVLVTGESVTTALVREVCTDVWEHFATIAWISIPKQNDFQEILLRHIVERAAFPGTFETKSWMSMDHEFSLQQEGSCLIVVDNLEDLRTWEKFEEVLRIVKTCRVIFIGRLGSSHVQIEERGHKFEPCELKGPLYEPPAYIPKDFHGKDSREICELIVRKCERLPKAIVFVLRNPRRSSEIIKGEWEARIPPGNLFQELPVIQQALETLHEGLHGDEGHELDLVQTALKIQRGDGRRFWFLYLGIFPENTPISYKKICRLWFAEGLLDDLKRAERFLDDDSPLAKCIRPVKRSDREPSTFKLNKSVRDIIVSLSNLSDLVRITDKYGANWLHVQGAIEALDEKKSPKISSIFMLDVSSNEDKITKASETTPFPPSSKVLDLTGAPFQIIPDWVFKLTELRYFCLRNTPIEIIPGSIRELTHLRFLDAKHSLVTELPKEFEELEEIRHILIYHHEKDPLMNSYNLIGFRASCSIRGFKHLGKLCFVEADETILKDLVNLTGLTRLGITKLREGHGKLLCSALDMLKNLKSLNVHALDEDEILNLHESQTSLLESLERLYLHGRLEKLPDWISSHNVLKRIILRWSHLEKDLLATLGNLRNLVELELRRAYDGEQMDFKKGQFPKLKILLLEELEGLRSMSLEKGTLPRLESLTISGCQWLEMIPSGFDKIHTLQKLTFFDMSSEFYDRVREDHEKDRYEKFAHIKEVYFARWRAGHWETHRGESADEAHCSHQVDSTDERVESTE